MRPPASSDSTRVLCRSASTLRISGSARAVWDSMRRPSIKQLCDGTVARSFHRFDQPQQIFAETGSFVQFARARVAGENSQSNQGATVFLRPDLCVAQEGPAHAAAFATWCHRDIRDVAVGAAGKEVARPLHAQEAETFAVFGFRDEQIFRSRHLVQSALQVAADAARAIAASPPR